MAIAMVLVISVGKGRVPHLPLHPPSRGQRPRIQIALRASQLSVSELLHSRVEPFPSFRITQGK